MLIDLMSDVHLEFGYYIVPDSTADVLVLSGDVYVASRYSQEDPEVRDFFSQVSAMYKHVVYVMGNHEHYHGDFSKTESLVREHIAPFPNIHLLEKQSITIDGVVFIGGTMWTNMNNHESDTITGLLYYMNDFRLITNGTKVVERPSFQDVGDDGIPTTERYEMKQVIAPVRFAPDDALAAHESFMHYLTDAIESNPELTYVVVTHHAPHKTSVKPRREYDREINGGYSSDLSDFITSHQQIKVWTHGHTHASYEYKVGNTLVVCNPRGYVGHERQADQFRPKQLTI